MRQVTSGKIRRLGWIVAVASGFMLGLFFLAVAVLVAAGSVPVLEWRH